MSCPCRWGRLGLNRRLSGSRTTAPPCVPPQPHPRRLAWWESNCSNAQWTTLVRYRGSQAKRHPIVPRTSKLQKPKYNAIHSPSGWSGLSPVEWRSAKKDHKAEAPCTQSLDSMIPERIVSWLPYRADEPTESAHRIRTGSNRGSKVSRFESVPGLVFVCTESARIPYSSSVVFAFVSFFFCCGVFFSAFFSCLSVVCATVTAPLTGVGGVLQRIQSDPLGSCACKFLWTRLHLHAIKDSIRVRNEPGIIESRLRVHGAWDMNFASWIGSSKGQARMRKENQEMHSLPSKPFLSG